MWAPGARGPRGVPSVPWGTQYYKVPLALGAPGVPCGAPWAGNLGYRWAYLGSGWPGLPFGPFGLWGAPAPALGAESFGGPVVRRPWSLGPNGGLVWVSDPQGPLGPPRVPGSFRSPWPWLPWVARGSFWARGALGCLWAHLGPGRPGAPSGFSSPMPMRFKGAQGRPGPDP